MGRERPPLLRVRDRDCFHSFFPAGSKRTVLVLLLGLTLILILSNY